MATINVKLNVFGKTYAYDNGTSVPRAVSSAVKNGLIDTVWNLTGVVVSSVDDTLHRLPNDKRIYDVWYHNAAESYSKLFFDVEMFNDDGQWWFVSTSGYATLKELLAENCRNHIRRVRWVCTSDSGFTDTLVYDTKRMWAYTHSISNEIIVDGYGDTFIDMCHSVTISVLERVYRDSHIYSVEE